MTTSHAAVNHIGEVELPQGLAQLPLDGVRGDQRAAGGRARGHLHRRHALLRRLWRAI